MENHRRPHDYYRLKAGYLRFKGALYDRTTGLFAFPFFFDRIRAMLQGKDRIGVVHLELDGLDLIEDRYGWQESDLLRVRVAEILLGLRESVLGAGALLACSGVHGKGFLLFLDESPEGGQVTELRMGTFAEEIGEAVHQGLQSVFSSESAGFLQMKTGSSLLLDLPLTRFERRVYHAVEQARGKPPERDRQERVRRLEELRQILHGESLETYFQPIVRMENRDLLGYEALARGPRNSSFEYPANLFCFSDQVGVSTELDGVCRDRALADAHGLEPGLKLFLNCLPSAIEGSSLRSEKIWNRMRKSRLSYDSIVFEITERTAIKDFRAFGRGVDLLRKEGYQVAIDDVGTGYSTLQAISEVQPEFLKIDMSLIRNIDQSLIKRGLVSSLVEMGEKIRACVIAEGIERREEMQALLECGVQYGQGYYFARPAPPFPTVSRSHLRDS